MPTQSAYASYATIQIDGRPDEAVGSNVVALTVEETIEGLYRCEIVCNNFGLATGTKLPNYLFFRRDALDFGKEITVGLGPSTPQAQVFKGRITALEATYADGGGAQLTVLAEDRCQDLRMTRRTRSYEDQSDADIIKQIAREHGLEADISLTGPTHKAVAQVNQSDLAFVRERARSLGGEVWVEAKTLHAKVRSARGGATDLRLAYGVELRSFMVRADLAHQCTELGIASWDTAAKDAIVETSQEDALGSELGGDLGGGTLLQQKFGAYPQRLVHTAALTTEEAAALAKARYSEGARRFVTGTGEAEGTPDLRVGTFVTLSDLGPLFDGKYYVVRTNHSFTAAAGYRTEFDVERPGIGRG